MNKQGSVALYGLMLGLTILIVALALSPVIKQFVDDARDSSNLDCNNDSISNFQKAGCYGVDISGFYFIGALIVIGGAVIGARIIFD